MSAQTIGVVPEITTGHRIRIAREYAGYDQGELAVLTGISRTTISNYEAGHTTHLKPLYLRQIALITGVDADWLATGVASSGDGGSVLDRDYERGGGFAYFEPSHGGVRHLRAPAAA